MHAAGVRFGCVLADAGYGLSAPFRQALSERGLTWAVGIPGRQKVYPADVALIFPVAGRGRPRQRHIPDSKSVAAQTMLEGAKWRQVSWRRGTKGRLSARFAAIRVRVADGAPQRIGTMGAQHMPGEEVWLVGEHRSSGERKYHLSNLPADTPIKKLAGAIKARWICEQAHQQLKASMSRMPRRQRHRSKSPKKMCSSTFSRMLECAVWASIPSDERTLAWSQASR